MAEQRGALASDMADESLEHPATTSAAADALHNGEAEEEGEEEDDVEEAGGEENGAGGSKKKKKKPKKKKKKAATDSTEVATSTPSSSAPTQPPRQVPVHDIQSLLAQLAVSNPQAKKEGKAPEDYKFWNTQPVPKFTEQQPPNLLQTTTNGAEAKPEGAILPDAICRASAKPTPAPLKDGFEWCLVDLDDEAEVKELYDLLDNHYVEDTDGAFRFKYSTSFLSWALKPPGWKKEWHIGVRTSAATPAADLPDGDQPSKKKGKLVAFIAGIPVTLLISQSSRVNATEINFLAIHRKLRGKRLAPELIKEVTRRCYLNGIYQALYTAGTLLPTPVSTCRYFHRSLDWAQLYKCGFSHLPPGSTESRQRLRYRLPERTELKGLRKMEEKDVPAVKALLERYLERFHLRQAWTDEEIAHWFISPAAQDVVHAYVVETGGKITDFISYYLLESSVLRSTGNRQERDTIRAAYLYYYATESAFAPSDKKTSAKQQEEQLSVRLQQLMHDALILAKNANFHVFNALTLLDNPLFLKEEKFEPGDGKLHYYLFNWRCRVLPGGVDDNNQIDTKKMGGVGVVML